MAVNADALLTRLGLPGLDLELLEQALTHDSYAKVTLDPQTGQPLRDNLRLAMRGRPLLEAGIVYLLDRLDPPLSLRHLRTYRDALVEPAEVAELSRAIELGRVLRLSAEELSVGGRDRDVNLAQAFEALMVVVFESYGWSSLVELLRSLLAPMLAEPNVFLPSKNPKGELLMLLAQRGLEPPTFREIGVWGPEHDHVFKMGLYVGRELMEQGEGPNKKSAEMVASQKALRKLRIALAEADQLARLTPAPGAEAEGAAEGTRAAGSPGGTSTATAASTAVLLARGHWGKSSTSKPGPGVSEPSTARKASRSAAEESSDELSGTRSNVLANVRSNVRSNVLSNVRSDETTEKSTEKSAEKSIGGSTEKSTVKSIDESTDEPSGATLAADFLTARPARPDDRRKSSTDPLPKVLEPTVRQKEQRLKAELQISEARGKALESLMESLIESVSPVPATPAQDNDQDDALAEEPEEEPGFGESLFDPSDDRVFTPPIPPNLDPDRIGNLRPPGEPSAAASARKGKPREHDYFRARFDKARLPPMGERAADPQVSVPDPIEDEDARFNQEQYHQQRMTDTLFVEAAALGRFSPTGSSGVLRGGADARAGGGRMRFQQSGPLRNPISAPTSQDHVDLVGENDPFDASLDAVLERFNNDDERRWRKMLGLNPKGALLEMTQKFDLPVPEFRQISVQGPSHAPIFTVALYVEGIEKASAEGRTRKLAEQDAARAWLAQVLAGPRPVMPARKVADSEG